MTDPRARIVDEWLGDLMAYGVSEADAMPLVEALERESKTDAYRQALIEIRDRCARVVDARAVARKVLGK